MNANIYTCKYIYNPKSPSTWGVFCYINLDLFYFPGPYFLFYHDHIITFSKRATSNSWWNLVGKNLNVLILWIMTDILPAYNNRILSY